MEKVQRQNCFIEKIVERGIDMDREAGSLAAWIYLQRHGIEPEIILRVLSAPSQRRGGVRANTVAMSP